LKLPIKDQLLDGIISVAVFHHIPNEHNRIDFIKECKRTLKRNGILILTVWSIVNIKNLIHSIIQTLKYYRRMFYEFGDAYVSWAGKYNRYYHFFSKKELKNLFLKAGLNKFVIMQFGTFPNKKNFLLIAIKS